MLTFPKSMVDRFVKQDNELRYGQEFWQWARLDKVQGSDRIFCDQLYQADGDEARSMIDSRTDPMQ